MRRLRVTYMVEIAAKESIKDDLEKTIEKIRIFGPKSISVGEERCEDGICSAFVEVELDGPWEKHVEFAKRFAPTVIEPFESTVIMGDEFFRPIMKMVQQARIMLAGSGIRVPLTEFSGAKHLSRDELDELIIDDRKYRVNLVFSSSLRNPSIILGAIERAVIVNNFLVKDNYIGVDVIGDLPNIVTLMLYFLPVAVEPVEPIEYDLSVQEIGEVLMVVSERSREIVSSKIKN